MTLIYYPNLGKFHCVFPRAKENVAEMGIDNFPLQYLMCMLVLLEN